MPFPQKHFYLITSFMIHIITVIMLLLLGICSGQDKTVVDYENFSKEILKIMREGKTEQALKFAQENADLYKNKNGNKSLEYGKRLKWTAFIYIEMRDFFSAEPILKETLEIFKEKDNNEYISGLANLARVYMERGNYEAAESFYKNAADLREKNQTDKNSMQSFALSLKNLAELYILLGDYEKAENHLKKASDMIKKSNGENSREYARILNDTALLYLAKKDFENADIFIQKAYNIFFKTCGDPDHDVVLAYFIRTQALSYIKMGKFQEAEQILNRSAKIFQNLNNNIAHASVLHNLANLYEKNNEIEKAEIFYKQAIEKKDFLNAQIDYPLCLNNLANLYRKMKKYDKAEPLYYLSMENLKKMNYNERFEYKLCLQDLIILYVLKENYDKAESFYQQFIELNEKTGTMLNPQTTSVMYEIAAAYISKQKYEKALEIFKKISDINDRLIDNVFSFTGEKQKLSFMGTINLNPELSICLERHNSNPEFTVFALNSILKRKGIILDSLVKRQALIYKNMDAETAKILNELNQNRAELAGMSFVQELPQNLDARLKRIDFLNKKIEEADKTLTLKSALYNEQKKTRFADVKEVHECLNPTDSLVEIFKFRQYDFINNKYQKTKYMAVIVNGGGNPDPLILNLGNSDEIDNLIKIHLLEIDKMVDTGNSGINLYKILWKPIEEKTGDRKNIIISPDGEINLLSFDSLQNNNRKYLIETHNISFISSGRDLIRYKTTWRSKGFDITLIGDPDFESAGIGGTASDSANASIIKDPTLFRSGIFKPLANVKLEIEEISEILRDKKIIKFTGKNASEENFKSLKSPASLHLATHGFLLPETGWQQFFQENEEPLMISRNRNPGHFVKGANTDNPMHRSGIALAGANRLIKGEKIPPDSEDGIVTAEEVSGINLEDTYLAVLSACSTGKGEIKAGEGVMGLRRAFISAGARTLIMTLWDIPDKEARLIMGEFYKKLSSGKSKQNSLREAKISLIESLRKENKSPHPILWASFILSGER